jgi:ABC-type Fe3+/spermidine/putrescine transport system ATPase subunit
MAYVIDYELLEKLEQKVGKEEAKKIAQTIELIYNELDKKSESLAQQKKLELKDELTKELATKADIDIVYQKLELLKTELEAKIEKEVLKLDRKFTIMFIVLAFLIIFINKDAIELIIKLLPFAK